MIATPGTLPNPGADWRVIGAFDFDRDGRSDLLLRNTDGTVKTWLMTGTQIAAAVNIGIGGVGWSVVAGTGG
jgi:hypothetical protein